MNFFLLLIFFSKSNITIRKTEKRMALQTERELGAYFPCQTTFTLEIFISLIKILYLCVMEVIKMKKFYTGISALVLTAAASCATPRDIELDRFLDKSMNYKTVSLDNGDSEIGVASFGDKPAGEPYKNKSGKIVQTVDIGSSSEVPPLYNGIPGDLPPGAEDTGEEPIECRLSE